MAFDTLTQIRRVPSRSLAHRALAGWASSINRVRMPAPRTMISVACAALLLLEAAPLAQSQSASSASQGFRVTSELVLVNVVVRDKKGAFVHGLTKDDFTLFEDGKRQVISSFDVENVDEFALVGPSEAPVSGSESTHALLRQSGNPTLEARDRRLMLLFFDFSAMEPEQIERSVDAAKTFVETHIQPADLLALVSLSTDLRVDLDFTADKTRILSALSAYTSSQGQGFSATDTTTETSGSYTPDDSDYNTFSADRKLLALQSIMQTLGKISQKKALIYFSNGISQSGFDNQSALRAATASAVKANVSIYPVDIQGLQAFPGGGEARSASLRGQYAYSGQSVLNDFNNNAEAQETLSTLAADTGGKAFFDSNDFGAVFTQVQKDSSAYYVIGFTSTNPLKDGRFRRLRVQVNRPDLRLEYRPGYYAGRDFEHLKRADREQQLNDELASELPQIDVAVYAGASYFRQDDSHYYLAVSIVIPGSQIPFVQAKDKDNATIDIIGEVRAGGKFRVGQLRDTVKLALDSAQQVRRKNVQYNTGFVLAPGSYHVKFIVRENQTGRMGSFETDVQVPDLRKSPLRMSSVVLSSLRVPATGKKRGGLEPLIQDQTELVPNITHVFTQDQHLYMQYEIYDAVHAKNSANVNSAQPASPVSGKTQPQKATRNAVRVLTSIEFLQGNLKVYESKPIVASEVTAPDRKAVVFHIDLPLESLKPGFYTCQVNVVDDVGGNFAFPRWPILIKPAAASASASSASGR